MFATARDMQYLPRADKCPPHPHHEKEQLGRAVDEAMSATPVRQLMLWSLGPPFHKNLYADCELPDFLAEKHPFTSHQSIVYGIVSRRRGVHRAHSLPQLAKTDGERYDHSPQCRECASRMFMKCLHFLASQSRCVHSMVQLTPVNDQAYSSSMRGFQLPSQNPNSPFHHPTQVRLAGLVEDVGQVAASAVLAVVHGSHEDTGTAL